MSKRRRGKFSRFYKTPFPNDNNQVRSAETIDEHPQPSQFDGMAVGLRDTVTQKYAGLRDGLSGLHETHEERKLDLSDLIS